MQAMGHFVGLLDGDILDWWLLDLCIFDSIKVAGSLQINMSINCFHQLPHAWGILFISSISSISLTLHGGRGSRVQDLLQIPQWGIFEHPYILKGCHLCLPEPMKPGLVDNGHHGVLSVHEALIVPLVLTGLRSCLQVSNFISLGQVQAGYLYQFKLYAPQLVFRLG